MTPITNFLINRTKQEKVRNGLGKGLFHIRKSAKSYNKTRNYTCSYLHIRLFYPKYPNLFSKNVTITDVIIGLRIVQRKMMKYFRPVYLLLTLLSLAWFVSSATAQTARPLPETYVSDDETMTLRYPTGWVVETDQSGMVIVATSEEMIDLGDENLPSG